MTWLLLFFGVLLYRTLGWIRITPMSAEWIAHADAQYPTLEYHSVIQQWPIDKLGNERAWRNTVHLRKRA